MKTGYEYYIEVLQEQSNELGAAILTTTLDAKKRINALTKTKKQIDALLKKMKADVEKAERERDKADE